MRSRYLELDGPTHVADFGGDGPPMVLVHGLGGSHVNWLAVGDRLARTHRVLAVDLVGHGRTPVAGRLPTPEGHRRLVDALVAWAGDQPAVLIGNSMGGLVSLLQAARSPSSVAGLVLVGPAVPTPRTVRPDPETVRNFLMYLLPGVGERYLDRLNRRTTPAERVQLTLELCTVDMGRVPADLRRRTVELAVERLSMPWATRAFLRSARSLVRLQLTRTAIDDAARAVQAPTLVVHGQQDRLVHVSAAHRLLQLRPDWQLEVLDDCGHVPMMEHAERFTDVVERWLTSRGDARHAA